VALIGAMSPQINTLIEEGFIQTVVAGTPEVHVVRKGEKIPPQKIFQSRYIVVTPDNLSQVLKRYPQFAPYSR